MGGARSQKLMDLIFVVAILLWFVPFCLASERKKFRILPIEKAIRIRGSSSWYNIGASSSLSSIFEIIRDATSNPYPTVRNLNAYINPLGMQSCLVVINNFQNIDILRFDYPVVLKYPKLAAVVTRVGNEKQYFLIWIPKQMQPGNRTLFTNDINSLCRMSKFLIRNGDKPTTRILDVCLRLDIIRFATSSKPWNCQAQLGLFPVLELFSLKGGLPYYPRNFYHGVALGGGAHSSGMIPSSMPPLNIFLTTQRLRNFNLVSFQYYMLAIFYQNQGVYDLQAPYLSHETFFVGAVSPPKYFGYRNFLLSSLITEIRLVRLSHEYMLQFSNFNDSPVLAVKLASDPLRPESLLKINQWTSSSPPDEMLIVHIPGHDQDSTSHQLRKILKSCPAKPESEEIVSKGHARVWLSIFGNYTFKTANGSSCTNGKITNLKVPQSYGIFWFYMQWLYDEKQDKGHAPMAVEYSDTLNHLRFVSCSELRRQTLPFNELISTYDSWVWISLITTMITLAATNTILGRRGSFTLNVLAEFEILVGQSGPYLHRLMKRFPLRFATLLFLFMSVILNEGYKNSNVYNMISPRKPLPYQTFSQLVQNNFTIYSSAAQIRFYMDVLENVETLEYQLHYHNNSIVAYYVVFVNSELMRIRNGNFRQLIIEHAMLHPSLLSTIRHEVVMHKHWFATSPSSEFGTDMNYQHSLQLEEIVRDWEIKTLLNFLRKCNNAALVTTERARSNFLKSLKVHPGQYFSVGKEVYETGSTGVYLAGLVPPVIVRRLKGIEVSGIWEWHSVLAQNGTASGIESEHSMPTRASMAGNVSVIFVTLLVGLIIAGVFFWLEQALAKLTQLFMFFQARSITNLSKRANTKLVLNSLRHIRHLHVNLLNGLESHNPTCEEPDAIVVDL